MTLPRNWFTVQVPEYFSAWLWRAFRRPRRFLLLVVVLPLVLVIVVTHRVNVTRAREQALQHLQVNARLAAEIIEETLEGTFHFAHLVMAQPGFGSAAQRGDRESLTQFLAETLPFIPRVDLAMVLNPRGEVVAVYPDRPELIGRDLSEQDPFRGAKHRRMPYVSSVYLRDGSRIEKVVGVVLPIMNGDAVVGFLQLQHRVEEVKSWLQKIRVGHEGFIYVVDHRDQLVAYPFQVLPGRPKVVSAWPTVREPLTPNGGTLVFSDSKHRKRWLAGFFPVGKTGWRVVAVQPEAMALKSLWQVFWILSVLAGMLLILVAAISFRWAQLHAFSLRLLRQNAKLLRQLQQRGTLGRGGQAQPPKGDAR